MNHHVRRSMQAFCADPLVQAGKQAIVGDLTRGFAATFSHRKSCHLRDTIPGMTQRIERFRQSKP
jgi:hypothetical protein